MSDLSQRLNAMQLPDEDRLLLAHCLDLQGSAARDQVTAATPFLNERQQAEAAQLWGASLEDQALLWGGYEAAVRRVILWPPDWLTPELARQQLEEGELDPLVYLRVRWSAEELTHRDLLGSLLGLGLDRGVSGDILVDESGGSADLVLIGTIASFVLDEYRQAGRARLTVERISRGDLIIPAQDYTDTRITLASLRLDAYLARAAHLSRGRAQDLISRGEVSVNGLTVVKPDRLVTAGDTINLRGRSRTTVQGIVGTSRKGRQIIELREYG